MQWEKLYSPIRFGDKIVKQSNPERSRNSYMRDYDRIIFSSAFRRLQNKTQVFPLPGAVFVHNRLTHSLEVSSVGRSLAKIIGDLLVEKHPEFDLESQIFYQHNLPYVIATACLAHDIGNPPFGHSGEDAIRQYFECLNVESAKKIKTYLSDDQWLDFLKFEGNSNALRVLTCPFGEDQQGGYNLTITSLSSIIKYPCNAALGFQKNKGIHLKKSGFFVSEKNVIEFITQHLQIPKLEPNVYARHPFVYVVEAADDICYRVIDLEDAHRLGIISLDTFMSLLLPFFEQEEGYNNISSINASISKIKDPNQKAQYVRARWIGLMVQKTAEVFIANEYLLLQGALQKDLISLLDHPYQMLIRNINKFSFDHIYNHKSVIEIELSGFHVIGFLLDKFIDAILNKHLSQSEKLLLLIPDQFQIFEITNQNMYQNIQSIVDWISGMTDLYAMDLYRKISGINIKGI